ncbi:MAG: hypothetical protein J5552_03260, partial [Prevotella sp.]|nr:hypothetical protein [Prevotella sp.]
MKTKTRNLKDCMLRAAMLLLAVMTTATAWADSVTVTSQTTSWAAGCTYNVTSNVTIGSRITVTGDVTLVIADGATLTASQGITIASGTLTIEGSGTLTATGENGSRGQDGFSGKKGDVGTAGISGDIIVNGATVHATGGDGGDGGNATVNPGKGGAGGDGGAGISGDVTFNSGIVIATGGAGGSGGSGSGGLMGSDGSNGAAGKGIGGTVTCNDHGALAQERDDNSTWSDLTADNSGKRYVRLLTDPNAVVNNIDVTSQTTSWAAGCTYNVTSNVTIGSRITVTGDVTLVIADGATLTASKGIT